MQANIRNLTLLLVLTSTLILGCKRSESSDPNTLIVAIGTKPATLDPRLASDAYGMRIAGLLFSSLVRLGPELKIIGEAAESWTYNNLIYTFQLKPGLTFSNGSPVTADDILFSFAQYQSSKSPHNGSYKMIKKVEARYDDKERFVKLYLESFSAALLNDLSTVKFLPKALLEQDEASFTQNPIGSGAFKLVANTPSEIVLEARPERQLKFKNLVFRVIADENTRYLKMLKGEIDIAQNEIPTHKIFYIENRRKDLAVYKAS
jgi:peptide/nickel transport system substrate-binding protein